MYRVLHWFVDLQDNNHFYSVGDNYPHNGVDVCEERIEELKTSQNKLGIPLIEEVAGNSRRRSKSK